MFVGFDFVLIFLFFEQNLWSPLHMAVSQNHYDVAEFLLKVGADIQIRNKVFVCV